MISGNVFLFFYFLQGFRSSGSTADLLAVVSDKIARLLIGRCGATRIVALEHPNNIQGFFRMWHVGPSLQRQVLEFQVGYLVIFLSFCFNRQVQVVLENLHKNHQLVLVVYIALEAYIKCTDVVAHHSLLSLALIQNDFCLHYFTVYLAI